MLVELDARQRQKIVDQPAHAPGFHAHDVEEAFARVGIVLGVAAQRVDEAADRGQGRAQFVAGIGDEIGAHLLGAAHGGQIVQLNQHQARIGRRHCGPHARDKGFVMALDRHQKTESDGFRLAARQHAVDRFQHRRRAQHGRDVFSLRAGAQQHFGGAVGEQHMAGGVEHDDGIGEAFENIAHHARQAWAR